MAISQVTIEGTALQYANETSIVYTYKDCITKIKEKLGYLNFDKKGNFSLQFELKKTRLVFFKLHSLLVFLYAEPGKRYELNLPKKIPKKKEQQVNPYFKHPELLVGIVNPVKDELNILIQKFDEEFDSFLAKNLQQLYSQDVSLANEQIRYWKEKYQLIDNAYFQVYLSYSFALLEYFTKQDVAYVLQKYYGEKIHIHNPTYCNLLIKMYRNFLLNSFSSHKTSHFEKDLYQVNSSKKLAVLADKLIHTKYQNLNRLIFLLTLIEAYSEGSPIGKAKCKELLIYASAFPEKNSKKVAENYLHYINYLSPNTLAPVFSLKTKTGTLWQPSQVNDEYILLNFISAYSKLSVEELKNLKNVQNQYPRILEIVTIVREDDYELLEKHFQDNNYSWTFLFADKAEEIYDTFRIFSYPKYLLIDKKGEIVASFLPGHDTDVTTWLSNIID